MDMKPGAMDAFVSGERWQPFLRSGRGDRRVRYLMVMLPRVTAPPLIVREPWMEVKPGFAE